MWLIALILSPFIIWGDIKLFKYYFTCIFSDKDDFDESIKYSFTSDWYSLFKGEYRKDYAATSKLSMFCGLCIGTVILEIFILNAIFF